MIVIDTDALSDMSKNNNLASQIKQHLSTSGDPDIRISIVSVFEMMEGVISPIRIMPNKAGDLPTAFGWLSDVNSYLARWADRVLEYGPDAHALYAAFPREIRTAKKKYDSMIGAIALVNGATVWTRNVRDFIQVPGLAVVDASTGQRAVRGN